MKLQIGNTYQLMPLPVGERKDGTIYLSITRVFRLLALSGDEAWIKCTESGKTFIVDADRLTNY